MNIVMDITDGGRKEVGSLRHVFCFNPSQLTCWTYSSCIVPFTRSSGASPGGYEWTTETETAVCSTQNRRDLAGCENLIWYNYNIYIYILKRRWPIPIYIYIFLNFSPHLSFSRQILWWKSQLWAVWKSLMHMKRVATYLPTLGQCCTRLQVAESTPKWASIKVPWIPKRNSPWKRIPQNH